MSEYIEHLKMWVYPISYIINKPKFDSYTQELGAWLKHINLQRSKKLGWYCELCGSKSKPKETYRHTLIQRVQWHINATYKDENGEIKKRCSAQPLINHMTLRQGELLETRRI